MNSGSARLGALTLSANALLLHLQSAQAFALDGFAHGAEVLTGEAIGMSARARLRRVIKASAHLTALTALLISAVYAIAHEPIFMLLTTHDEVVSLAIEVAPWVIVSPLISAPCFLLDGVMIGATQASSMRRGMITSAVIFALIAMIGVPLLGNHGLWLAFLCFMATRALSLTPTLLRLYRG
jgi:MATE family multidrug resistance protein